MIKKLTLFFGFIIGIQTIHAQNKQLYYDAFDELSKMLKGDKPLDFKRAVFITENAYHNGTLSYSDFDNQLKMIETQIRGFLKDKNLTNNPFGGQYGIFSYMMESSVYNNYQKLTYDFDDIMGHKDYTKLFVTKLLRTKSGNCHSLPFLYKILAEDMKVEAYLALAPNHVFIKHREQKGGWVNVELTNGGFPRDSWMISSLDITTEAIRTGIYMHPLSLKESIALCMVDLGEGFQIKYGNDDFCIKCCDEALKYDSNSINAYLFKSNVMTLQREQMLKQNGNVRSKEVLAFERQIKKVYSIVDSLGFKQMDKGKYEEWNKEFEKEKAKKSTAKK